MSFTIQILAIVFLLVLLILITHFVKNSKISIKYSIIWYLSLFILLIFTVFPNILGWTSNLIGVEVSSNFLFAFMLATLFIICISLTIIVSNDQERIRVLIQEISILNSEREKKDEKKNR